MWSPHQTPEPVEKIRKARWSIQNTANTQAVVDELEIERKALRRVTGNSKVVEAMTTAVKRFCELDPAVKLKD